MSEHRESRKESALIVKECMRCYQDEGRPVVDGGCRCELAYPVGYTFRRYVEAMVTHEMIERGARAMWDADAARSPKVNPDKVWPRVAAEYKRNFARGLRAALEVTDDQ